MTRTLLSFAIILASIAASQAAETDAQRAERMKWWRDARFGMFIHWGPVSIKGTEIGWSRGAQVPTEEYDNLYKKFNPTKFNADEWAKIAKDAGMKYMVLTTKHHDGFCLFDTKQTDFNIMNSPFKRDVTKELADACRKQGLVFCTYHSVCDWHHPDFPHGSPGGSTLKPKPDLDRYEQYLTAQVGELIKNYGPLGVMWFDVSQDFDAARGKRVVDRVRAMQPSIIINNRCANPGDYDTPEQTIGGFQIDRPWETCMTICNQWAWKPGDEMKPLKQCLQTLITCAGGDGNLLFNVGPMPTGEIEARQVARLKEMGQWLAKYGDTIYGTRGGPYKPSRGIVSTRKGNEVYIHVLKWNGETVTLPLLPSRKILFGSLVTNKNAALITSEANGQITLKVYKTDQDEIDTIIKLKLDGPADDIPPVAIGRPGLIKRGMKATASNVFQREAAYAAEKAVDGDSATRWATDGGTHKAWLEVDLGRETTFTGAEIDEAYAGRVRSFELQAKAGDEWKTFYKGKTIGEDFSIRFPAVTAQYVRLNILEAIEGPTINEFQLVK